MRGERQHHVVDEQLVGLCGPAQSFQERRADIAKDRVVMADASLASEIANARRAGLFE